MIKKFTLIKIDSNDSNWYCQELNEYLGRNIIVTDIDYGDNTAHLEIAHSEGWGWWVPLSWLDEVELELFPDADPQAQAVVATIESTTTDPTTTDPLAYQVGGDHYSKRGIQPIEYIQANELNFCEGSIVKYITRWKDKGGIRDLQKIQHYAEFLIAKARKEGMEE